MERLGPDEDRAWPIVVVDDEIEHHSRRRWRELPCWCLLLRCCQHYDDGDDDDDCVADTPSLHLSYLMLPSQLTGVLPYAECVEERSDADDIAQRRE